MKGNYIMFLRVLNAKNLSNLIKILYNAYLQMVIISKWNSLMFVFKYLYFF